MIGIIGAGAFGTALAIALAQDQTTTLWVRNPDAALQIATSRQNPRLPNTTLPQKVSVTADLAALAQSEALLLAIPMQALAGFLAENASRLPSVPLIACCKGIDLTTLRGPTAILGAACPDAITAILTGPSFAVDIARGLPTALTLACLADEGEALQHLLSTPNLRLYRSTDVIGAELGGALKNVIAIAAGIVIGAGLGDSARAALMTRGYAEMQRLALTLGAQPETLAGLSGLGDLVLTCTSLQSRNLRFGIAMGAGTDFDRSITVEGVATAKAVAHLARNQQIAMPITQMVAALIDRTVTMDQAIRSLMSRPLKQE
ncbi:MAG: NAD(P)-dependent glycerol-3-phosphate dehydrogenase [Pseudorhodobacter sp.]|nr:NAD(P)-dependent glycerol-3-phosphate dehydrogenase [Pseudorhodobacter sp.]